MVGVVAIFALFLGLQVGASVAEHDHGTVADGIECVVCHSVRVAPPSSQPVTRTDAATEITVAPSRAPETAPPAIAIASTDLPRGPPAA